MSSWKLTYFDSKGRAEPCRMLFAVAGEAYDDVRLTSEQWQKLKPDTPFGQLPMLEKDGQTPICQSVAMARWLAREFGLYGKSSMDQARGDMIIDCFGEIMSGLMEVAYAKEDKEGKHKKYQDETLPPQLKNLEKQCKSGGHFLPDSGLTWVDIMFFCNISFFDVVKIEINWENYKNLNAVRKEVAKNDKIKAWIAKRPDTKM